MKNNLKEINGNEIIDFLNTLNTDEYPVDDISIELKSFVFEGQRVEKDRYILDFTASYNNWGTSQDIHDNQLIIKEDNLWFSLEEPFDGDGTSDTLEIILEKWIQSHLFSGQDELFNSKMEEVYELLPQIALTDVKGMDNIINILTEAKSLMKDYDN